MGFQYWGKKSLLFTTQQMRTLMVPLFFFSGPQALEVIQCAQDIQDCVTGKEHRVKGSDVHIEIGGKPAPRPPWEQQSQ